jgi:murein DD-endopeptidase MepM/ murein hydrolase activator NlpD
MFNDFMLHLLCNRVGFRKVLFFKLLFILLSYVSAAKANGHKIIDRAKVTTVDLTRDSVAMIIDNDLSVPLTIKVKFKVENLYADTTEFSAIVPAKVSAYTIAAFKRKISSLPYNYTYSWRLTLGDTSLIPDQGYLYRYPYHMGRTYRVSQGPGGSFSHTNSFAYDFAMPIGTAVTAVRDGVVALRRSDSEIGGPDSSYIHDVNFVAILHDDGSIARYVHLDTGGVIVEEGQLVRKGQVIGYSGNTGFSTGPHLHFEIIQPDITSNKKRYVTFKWEEPANIFFQVKRYEGPFEEFKFDFTKQKTTKSLQKKTEPVSIIRSAYNMLLAIFS